MKIFGRPAISNDCFFLWLDHFLDVAGPVTIEQAFDVRVVADMARAGAQWRERVGATRIVEISLLADLLIAGFDPAQMAKRIRASAANVRLALEAERTDLDHVLAIVEREQSKSIDPYGYPCSRRYLIYEVARFMLADAGWKLEVDWTVPRAELQALGPSDQTWVRPINSSWMRNRTNVNVRWRSATLPEALEDVSRALALGMP